MRPRLCGRSATTLFKESTDAGMLPVFCSKKSLILLQNPIRRAWRQRRPLPSPPPCFISAAGAVGNELVHLMQRSIVLLPVIGFCLA